MLFLLNIIFAVAIIILTYKYFELKERYNCEEIADQDYLKGISTIFDENEFYTIPHSAKVAEEAEKISRILELDENQIKSIKLASYLHDCGESLYKSDFLKQAGPLSEGEWQLLKFHPCLGERALRGTLQLSDDVPSIIRWHHEWWDGSGYPDNLAGEQIPLASRILTVADAACAMSCDRPYRQAFSPEQIDYELEKMSGIMFDPSIVKARMSTKKLKVLSEKK
ncbi:MAG: HD domain-containing protein [Candidatus Riflebacteria bacterium]|nr:HD domain-containing protein [Candidatus Riflebacteria bacterium]